MQEKEELYWYWLCNLSGIGNKRIKRLLDVFKSPKAVFLCGAGSTARLYRSYTAKHRNDYEKQKYGKSL